MKTYNGRLHPEDKGIPALYNAALKLANEWQKNRSYNATEEECVGLLLALHFAWDGAAIMRVFSTALEDANCHTYARTVRDWIKDPIIDTTVVDG